MLRVRTGPSLRRQALGMSSGLREQRALPHISLVPDGGFASTLFWISQPNKGGRTRLP